MVSNVVTPKNRIAEFCKRNRISRLALYGSVLRDDFRADSDIDVLVEFEPGRRVGFIRLAAMERELSELFGGRTIDMRTPNDLSRYFRDDVVRSAVVEYVEG